MNQNKNQLTITTGTGVALRNASKSLKITNKLLAEVDDFEKQWQWWLSLDDKLRMFLLKDGLKLACVDYKFDQQKNSNKYDLFTITKLDINWHDKNLMKYYIQQIFELSFLDIMEISDLSPLGKLTKLKVLHLYDLKISDISTLSTLTGLNTLYLQENKISDISALANLTNLTKLYLHRNQIKDISALGRLVNLKTLYLHANQIDDVSVLANLNHLSFLNLNVNPISHDDKYWLQQALPNCQIQGIDSESRENWLWWINLSTEWKAFFIKDVLKSKLLDYETRWDDNSKTIIFNLIYSEIDLNAHSEVEQYINALIEDVIELDLSSSPIIGIDSTVPLEKLINLQKLDLSQNVIHDVSFLENLENLIELNLSHIYGNIWSGLDISCITNLNKLKDVWLYETVIVQDIDDIHAFLPNCNFHY